MGFGKLLAPWKELIKLLLNAGVNQKSIKKFKWGASQYLIDLIKKWRDCTCYKPSDNKSSKEDAKKIRQSVLMNSVSYITTVAAARATALAIKELKLSGGEIEPKAIQDYLNKS